MLASPYGRTNKRQDQRVAETGLFRRWTQQAMTATGLAGAPKLGNEVPNLAAIACSFA